MRKHGYWGRSGTPVEAPEPDEFDRMAAKCGMTSDQLADRVIDQAVSDGLTLEDLLDEIEPLVGERVTAAFREHCDTSQPVKRKGFATGKGAFSLIPDYYR